jgi:hypothetical protein
VYRPRRPGLDGDPTSNAEVEDKSGGDSAPDEGKQPASGWLFYLNDGYVQQTHGQRGSAGNQAAGFTGGKVMLVFWNMW